MLAKYDDENLALRRQFIGNIPYLRDIDSKIIDRLVTHMKQHIFHQDEVVLQQGHCSDKIMIII